MDTDFRANPLPPPLAKGGAVDGYEGPEDPSGIELRESVTILLTRLTEGDVKAADALFPLLYDELRRIAHRQLRAERTGHTLSTTALVHEAYLRLVDQTRAHWSDRVHFLAVASRTMRRVLVDHARRVRAAKRGVAAAVLVLTVSAVLAVGLRVQAVAVAVAVGLTVLAVAVVVAVTVHATLVGVAAQTAALPRRLAPQPSTARVTWGWTRWRSRSKNAPNRCWRSMRRWSGWRSSRRGLPGWWSAAFSAA